MNEPIYPSKFSRIDYKIKKYPFEVVKKPEAIKIHIWKPYDRPFAECEKEIQKMCVRIFGNKTQDFELTYFDAKKIQMDLGKAMLHCDSFEISITGPLRHIYAQDDLTRAIANVLSEYK